jgi:hypothetical protein
MLIWAERGAVQPNTGKALAQLLELLGGGTWAMGERFDYFIEPVGRVGHPNHGITYLLEQTTPESGGLNVVQNAYADHVEELERVAQSWEDSGVPNWEAQR